MILRRQTPKPLPTFLVFFLLLSVPSVFADDEPPFNCHLTVDDLKFDLTSLAGEHTVSRIRKTPPSAMEDSLRFDLCAELKPKDGIAERDQCPSGTRACLTKINKKPDNSDRIVAVIPISQSSSLRPTYTNIASPRGLSLILHGSDYPHPSNSTLTPQSLNLALSCDPSEVSEPKFISYDGAELKLEWSAPAGCSFAADDDHKGDDKTPDSGGDKDKDKDSSTEENVGSGIGWFFLALLLSFAAYFGLGAYYNYSTYGARGADLIPHRDFWKEVPYMLSDVVSHLCSSARPRQTSSRGGYIAV